MLGNDVTAVAASLESGWAWRRKDSLFLHREVNSRSFKFNIPALVTHSRKKNLNNIDTQEKSVDTQVKSVDTQWKSVDSAV